MREENGKELKRGATLGRNEGKRRKNNIKEGRKEEENYGHKIKSRRNGLQQ